MTTGDPLCACGCGAYLGQCRRPSVYPFGATALSVATFSAPVVAPYSVTEYKRRLRAVRAELQRSPVLLRRDNSFQPEESEFAHAIACLRWYGIELGDDARLTWDDSRNAWNIE